MEVLIPLVIAVFIGTNFGKKILAFIPEKVFQLLFRGGFDSYCYKAYSGSINSDIIRLIDLFH